MSTGTPAVVLVIAVAMVLSPLQVTPTSAATSAAETAALLDLRNATGFPVSLSNWSSGDPCASNWTGVTCSVSPVAVVYVLK